MTEPSASPEPKRKRSFLDGSTGTIVKITALLVAITALLTAITAFFGKVPMAQNAVRSAYCAFVSCNSSKVLTFANLTTRDGGGHKSGTMTNIQVSLVDNEGKGPDTYIAEWTWSGSGGTQHGNETVIIDLKSASGATVETIKYPLDRAGCYYPGHKETYSGNLTVAPALVVSINVTVTSVEGGQDPC
jgi:hypothetical protein